VDNGTRKGKYSNAGVPEKRYHVDSAPVHNGNKRGNKEAGEGQDPQVHDKRFSKDEIKGDFLEHR